MKKITNPCTKNIKIALPLSVCELSPTMFKTYLCIDLLCRCQCFQDFLVTPFMVDRILCSKTAASDMDLLNRAGVIKKINDIHYEVHKEPFTHLQEYFVHINSSDFFTLLNESDALFRFYIAVLASFDYREGFNGLIGHMSQSYFAQRCNLCMNTVRSYFARLQDLGLIYVAPRKDMYSTNLYCRAEDKELIYSDAPADLNFMRSVSQRYNLFAKDPEAYAAQPEKLQSLYTDCLRYNSECAADKRKDINLLKLHIDKSVPLVL